MSEDKYIQIAMPDNMRLAELVIKAKGPDRTMAQFSEKSGISTSTLSRIANGKISRPLTVDVLQRIFDSRSQNSDISFPMLLLANGMSDSESAEKGRRYTERLLGTDSMKQRNEVTRRQVKNILVEELLARGIPVQKIPDSFENRRYESPYGISLPFDFNFYISDSHFKSWYFIVMDAINLPTGTGKTFQVAARFFLVDAWQPNFMNGTKTTFVFTNYSSFERFVCQYKGAPLNSPMTALLVDINTQCVVEEIWLSDKEVLPSVLDQEPHPDKGFIAAWEDEEDYELDDEDDAEEDIE